MTSDHRNPAADDPAADDATTGVPGLRTWRAVYVVVAMVFVLWIVLLTILTESFS